MVRDRVKEQRNEARPTSRTARCRSVLVGRHVSRHAQRRHGERDKWSASTEESHTGRFSRSADSALEPRYCASVSTEAAVTLSRAHAFPFARPRSLAPPDARARSLRAPALVTTAVLLPSHPPNLLRRRTCGSVRRRGGHGSAVAGGRPRSPLRAAGGGGASAGSTRAADNARGHSSRAIRRQPRDLRSVRPRPSRDLGHGAFGASRAVRLGATVLGPSERSAPSAAGLRPAAFGASRAVRPGTSPTEPRAVLLRPSRVAARGSVRAGEGLSPFFGGMRAMKVSLSLPSEKDACGRSSAAPPPPGVFWV